MSLCRKPVLNLLGVDKDLAQRSKYQLCQIGSTVVEERLRHIVEGSKLFQNLISASNKRDTIHVCHDSLLHDLMHTESESR